MFSVIFEQIIYQNKLPHIRQFRTIDPATMSLKPPRRSAGRPPRQTAPEGQAMGGRRQCTRASNWASTVHRLMASRNAGWEGGGGMGRAQQPRPPLYLWADGQALPARPPGRPQAFLRRPPVTRHQPLPARRVLCFVCSRRRTQGHVRPVRCSAPSSTGEKKTSGEKFSSIFILSASVVENETPSTRLPVLSPTPWIKLRRLIF